MQPNDTTATLEQPEETPTETNAMSEEQLREELARVRRESASRRIELRDYKEKATKWEEYQQSQLTEQERLAQSLADAQSKVEQLERERLKSQILREAQLPETDLEFLTANDEAGLKAQATRLAARTAPAANSNPALDLLAGKRGAPVGAATPSIDDMIRASARR